MSLQESPGLSQYRGVSILREHRYASSGVPPPPREEPVLNRKLRRPIVGLAACVLVGAAFAASPASAAPGADPSFAPSALASRIDSQLGARTAGSYVDSAGKVVVDVTDTATAGSVTAAGATPRYVARSGAA